MIYAVSDIHGCYAKYKKLLETIILEPEDTLYVLGDVIDRGSDGFKIMLDMAQRFNVVNLMGDHEAMAINALPRVVDAIKQGKETALVEENEDALELWFSNGGELSLADFLCLDNKQEKVVWEYMRRMPLYKELEVTGRKFVLLHGGLENFSPDRSLLDYAPREILWCRPEPDTVYYPNRYVVFGHTPVQHLDPCGNPEDVPAKIYHGDHIIDIDCGCVFPNGQLGCLCLDTMEEFYV